MVGEGQGVRMKVSDEQICVLAREMQKICDEANRANAPVGFQNKVYAKQKAFILHVMAMGRQYDANTAP